MNFVICGLPRSGTTIIARFIGGLLGVHVEHEPYQRAVKFGRFPPDVDTHEHNHMLMDHWGFKEPFWGIDEGCQFRNDSVLKAHRKCGWKFIFVRRDLRDVMASLRKWGISDKSVMENIFAFDRFVEGEKFIQYEDFCASPIATWNALMPLPVKADYIILGPSPETERMGDERAFNSTEIVKT